MTHELQPFNQVRFDACMAWVAKQFDRTISQYEAVKVHALADALHVVRHHRPIIGGTLRKLTHGPVNLDALNRAKQWEKDRTGPFELSARRGNALFFAPRPGPACESMFTASEREAILDAAKTVFSMTCEESQRFFHGETDSGDDFLGKAWRKTRGDKTAIDWAAILDAYADQTGEDAASLKSLVCA